MLSIFDAFYFRYFLLPQFYLAAMPLALHGICDRVRAVLGGSCS
jgi:hypothetical protein